MADLDLAFIVLENSRETARISWREPRMTMGRGDDVDIRLDDPTMSSRHAEIINLDGIRVRDLESLNGTRLNGKRIRNERLYSGDRIRVGKTTLLVVGSLPERPKAAADDTTTPPHRVEPPTSGGHTLRVALDTLRSSGTTAFGDQATRGDSHRILLLRDLFESLKGLEDSEVILEAVRTIHQQAYPRARVFVLRPVGKDWHDPATIKRPSLTFVSEAAQAKSALLSTSMPSDDRFSDSESVRVDGIQSAIAAPVMPDEEVRAVICIDRLVLPPFTKSDLNLLGIAANHVSAVLENAARIAELRRARERLAALNRNLETIVDQRTAEVRRQADEIAELAEAKDELLGIAAHDIRGPLTVIQGTTELLQLRRHEVDTETLNDSLGVIRDAAVGLGRLLSELLDAKAIESGSIHLERVHCPVQAVIARTTPIARLAAQNKGIKVQADIPRDLEIYADPLRLGQALNNLLLNAVKFSKENTRIRLRGFESDDGTSTVLVVEDQGVGIPEHELSGIFREFEQGEAGRVVGGSGLGLMIAKRLIELHDGQLAVESEVGVGTRFQLTIPLDTAVRQSAV